MAHFSKKLYEDWCHICGTRQDTGVEISFANNAEHEVVSDGKEISGYRKREYIRICADCGETIARIGRGEMMEAVRNNPALTTGQIKGFSPYFRSEVN